MNKYLDNLVSSRVYTFEREEIERLLNQLVKDQTGVDVTLHVYYFGEYNTDVAIQLLETENFTETQLEALATLIDPEEDFVIRDALVEALTGTENAHLEYHVEEDGESSFLLWIKEKTRTKAYMVDLYDEDDNFVDTVRIEDCLNEEEAIKKAFEIFRKEESEGRFEENCMSQISKDQLSAKLAE